MRTVPLKYAAAMNQRTLPEDTPDDRAFRYVDISAVDDTGAIAVPEQEISFADAPSRARRLANDGSTVVSTVRTYLRAIGRVPPQPDSQLVFSTGFAVLEAEAGVDSRFLYYACRSDDFVEEVVARSFGVSYPAINPSDLGRIAIPLPALEEQRRIADFLDDQVTCLSQVLEKRAQQSRLIEERYEAAVAALFTGMDDQQLALRRALRDALVGIVIQPAALYTDEPDGVPAIRGMDIGEGAISGASPVRLTRHGHAANRRSWLRTGDVIIVRTGRPGTAAVVPPQMAGWNCIDVVVARPDPSVVLSEYLEVALNAARLEHVSESSGSIQQHLGVGAVRGLRIPVPGVSRQRDVAQQVMRLRSHRAHVGESLARSALLLEERKRALITAAVTGEFDVSSASSRAAAVVTGE